MLGADLPQASYGPEALGTRYAESERAPNLRWFGSE